MKKIGHHAHGFCYKVTPRAHVIGMIQAKITDIIGACPGFFLGGVHY